MTARPSADTSLQGGLTHLADTFATLTALEERLAEVEYDLTGRNAFKSTKSLNVDKWDELDLLPRMGETVIALADLTQTLRQRLEFIASALRKPSPEDAVN